MLDRFAAPQVRLRGRTVSSYRLCGYTGLALAVFLGAASVIQRDLSLVVLVSLVVVAVVTFLALVFSTKIVTGEETIIYYHHEIAVLAAAALFLRLAHQPVLAYLDVTILGIGLFLAFGRIGCFMVGCCQGRPARWGVRYGADHVQAGFPACYAGVRLFPVQILESLFVFLTVAAGCGLLLRTQVPGQALAWYTVVYGWARFGLEFLRGDSDRPYLLGFSQPQWISLFLMTGLVVAELNGKIPLHAWHAAAAAGLWLTMAAVAVSRRLRSVPKHLLLHPQHVQELAESLRTVFDPRRQLRQATRVGSTSLGIQISGDVVRRPGSCTFHYAVSSRNAALTEASARVLARLIVRLRHPSCTSSTLIRGNHGVFHILVPLARRGTASWPEALPAATDELVFYPQEEVARGR